MFEGASLKTIATVAVCFTVIALLAGLALDPGDFLGNLLAELVGVLASVLLALFIVDKVIERERSKRWDLVSDETTTTLRFAVIRAGHHVYLLLPTPRDPEADPYTLGLLQENRLSDALRKLAWRVRERPSLEIEGEVASGLQPHMELIRGGVMPQLLAIGKHDLIARLAALEGAFQELQHTVWLEQRLGHMRQSSDTIAKLIEALAAVSDSIDEPASARDS